jgi:hypothetical protein
VSAPARAAQRQAALPRRPQRPPGQGGRSGWLALALLLASLVTGCSEEPLPQRSISHDDCLSDLRMDKLKQALERCDKVVAAYPNDPLPLNERYLLHTLAEDDRAACRDIARAGQLAKRTPAPRLDAGLGRDLEHRQADCRAAGLGSGTPGSEALQQLPHQNR